MKSKVIEYWQNQVKYARNRLSRAERQYLEIQESCWKYVCNFGFINQDLKERTEKAFLNAGRMFIEFQNITLKYLQVKGSESLHESA